MISKILECLKYIVFIFALLLSWKGFAQFEHIDQSDLYKKFKIQEVNAFDNNSARPINDERWLIDKKGRIYWHKLLETEDDSTFSLYLYFYEKDQLVKSHQIGIWNTQTNKVDTGTTVYSLNQKGQIRKSYYSNTRNENVYQSTYNYNGGLLTSYTSYDSYSNKQTIDSIIYYANSIPHIKKHIFLLSDFNSDTLYPTNKKISYYDTTGRVNLILEFIHDTNGEYIPIKSESFVYQNDQLIEVISLWLGTHAFGGPNLRRKVGRYYYDNKGLVIRIERSSDHETKPYLVYTYSYK